MGRGHGTGVVGRGRGTGVVGRGHGTEWWEGDMGQQVLIPFTHVKLVLFW